MCFHISSKEFSDFVKKFAKISPFLRISSKDISVTFSVEEQATDAKLTFIHSDEKAKLEEGKCIQLETTRNNIDGVEYALKYLLWFSQAHILSELILIKVSQNVPILFQFQLKSNGSIQYYLAPKKKNDDEE